MVKIDLWRAHPQSICFCPIILNGCDFATIPWIFKHSCLLVLCRLFNIHNSFTILGFLCVFEHKIIKNYLNNQRLHFQICVQLILSDKQQWTRTFWVICSLKIGSTRFRIFWGPRLTSIERPLGGKFQMAALKFGVRGRRSSSCLVKIKKINQLN